MIEVNIDNEEQKRIEIYPDPKRWACCVAVYPSEKRLSAPSCTGLDAEEFKIFHAAILRGMQILGWEVEPEAVSRHTVSVPPAVMALVPKNGINRVTRKTKS